MIKFLFIKTKIKLFIAIIVNTLHDIVKQKRVYTEAQCFISSLLMQTVNLKP